MVDHVKTHSVLRSPPSDNRLVVLVFNLNDQYPDRPPQWDSTVACYDRARSAWRWRHQASLLPFTRSLEDAYWFELPAPPVINAVVESLAVKAYKEF